LLYQIFSDNPQIDSYQTAFLILKKCFILGIVVSTVVITFLSPEGGSLMDAIDTIFEMLRIRRLSVDELKSLRDRKLRVMIRHAFETVPYYRALFTSAGLSPKDVQSTDDLKKIPVTTKEDLTMAGLDNILTRGTEKGACSICRTSGSSGKPFSTYLGRRERMIRRLLGLRRLVDAGFRPLDRVCILCDPVQSSGRRFRTRYLSLALPAQQQIEFLQEMQPTILKGWPSCLRVLLHHAGYQLGHFIKPRIVVTSGEMCDEEFRRALAADLKTEVFDFYGAGEFGPIASECHAHQGLHVNADQLIVECLDDDQTNGTCGSGEIVMTSLYSFTMPFIRYRIGDRGSIQERPCPCGSSFPLLTALQGQRNYTVSLPDGRLLSIAALVNTALRPFPTLHKFRLIQESIGQFVLETAFLEQPTTEIISRIRGRICDFLGSGVELSIVVVDSIDEEGVRKFGNFVSRLSNGQMNGPLVRCNN
jgi:phenylacetate-CoA ligase